MGRSLVSVINCMLSTQRYGDEDGNVQFYTYSARVYVAPICNTLKIKSHTVYVCQGRETEMAVVIFTCMH